MTIRFILPALVLAQCLAGHARALDLSLDQAIALARERSPLVEVERQRLAEAEADYKAAAAGVLPRVALAAYHNRLNDDRLSPVGGGLPVTLFAREDFIGLQARQLLFDGGRTADLMRASRHGIDAQRTGIENLGDDLALQVTQGYARVLESAALVDVTRDALRRQDAFVALADVQFHAGRATRLDGLRAEAQREDARRTHDRAMEAEKLSRVILRRVLALPADEPLRLTDQLPAMPPAPREDAVLAGLALARHPELRRLGQQIDQAVDTHAAARSARLPEVSLQGAYGNRARDVGGSALEWTLGLFASWTLYDGGALDSQAGRAHARVMQLEESRRALRIAIEADVRDAASAWRTARADAVAAHRLLAANQAALDAATVLYRSGRATALDVLTAEAELTRAQGAVAQARAAFAIARARVARLTATREPDELEAAP